MEIERDRVSEVIQTLPLHGKLILYAVLTLTRNRGSTTTGEVYSYYRRLCKRLGIESVTQRRASDIVSELDMLGLIDARIVSRGRYGKTRIITLSVSPDAVEAALLEDPQVKLAALHRD